jgi:uncharacterized membrane protein YdjX (TVP38/TMEM64 family)
MNAAVHPRLPRLKPWQWGALALGGAAAVAALVWLLRLVPVQEVVETVKAWGPLRFFSAFAVLTSIGAPTMPFYLAAGATFKPFALAAGGTLAAMTANMAMSYALARWLLRPVVERLARRFGYTVPVVRPENRRQITLLVRITPGPPFFVQHCLLALAGIPFGTYMLVSVPVCGLLAVAAVAAGAGLTSGSTVGLIVGGFVLVAAIIGIRLVRRAVQRRAGVHVGRHGEIEPEPASGPEAR